MAIIFQQQKKQQQILILILAFVLLVTVFVVWRGFFKKDSTNFSQDSFSGALKEEVKINFYVLNSPLLKELQLFPSIEPFKEEATPTEKKVGRENPFLPY